MIRFVARTIRFIVMTAIVQCSDAWTKRHFKSQLGLGKYFFGVGTKLWTMGLSSPTFALIHYRHRGEVSHGDGRTVFNLLSMILSGLITGLAARFFYPGAVHMGLGKTILLGIGGSLLAGLAASWQSGGRWGDGVNRAGCIASVLGAMLLIFIARHF